MTPAPGATPGGRAVTASAPGKLILMGEHAVVYGRPALVAAVDLRLTTTLAERPAAAGRRTVRLEVPRLALARELAWDDVLAYTRRAGESWRRWARGTTAGSFATLRGTDPTHVVQVALGEAAAFLGDTAPPALDLAIDSDLPLGSGFGSSAAVAVAVAAGYCALRGARPAADEIAAVALEVERRQHGLPSGVDAATVLHGGVLWAERDAGGGLAVTPLGAGGELLAGLAVFDSGSPAEGTGAVVAAVRERFAADEGRLGGLWDRIEAATRELRDLLERTARGAGDGLDAARRRVCELVRRCEAGLEELGVVPAPVRALVRRVEAAGGAAKVSGAGSLAGPGAGSLLVCHPRPERVAEWPFLAGLTRYPVVLGGPGLRVEAGAEVRP